MDYVIIGNKKFETLVAITEDEILQGLMWKSWPPPVMAFPFKTSEPRKFWMKNTISPLDIVFCNNNHIIDIVQGVPLSKELVGPDSNIDLVVEFPKGTIVSHNISLNDFVDIKYSMQTLARKFENQ